MTQGIVLKDGEGQALSGSPLHRAVVERGTRTVKRLEKTQSLSGPEGSESLEWWQLLSSVLEEEIV